MFHQPQDLTAHLKGLSRPCLHQFPLAFLTGPQSSRFSFSRSNPMHLMALSLQPTYRELSLSMNRIKLWNEGSRSSFGNVECWCGTRTSVCPAPTSIWCSDCYGSPVVDWTPEPSLHICVFATVPTLLVSLQWLETCGWGCQRGLRTEMPAASLPSGMTFLVIASPMKCLSLSQLHS